MPLHAYERTPRDMKADSLHLPLASPQPTGGSAALAYFKKRQAKLGQAGPGGIPN